MFESARPGQPGGDRLLIASIARADGAELRLSGELTIATVSDFDEQLRHAESASPAVLVVDLRDVRFLDSVALRVLVAADNRSREGGRRLRLITTPGPVERLFAVTRLDARLDIAHGPPAP